MCTNMGGIPGGRVDRSSPEYIEAYNDEISRSGEFKADFALLDGMTKSHIAQELAGYEDVYGKSLIGETQQEVDMFKRLLRNANGEARIINENAKRGIMSPMSRNALEGMKQGLRENIAQREKAIEAMKGARSEYEKYKAYLRQQQKKYGAALKKGKIL